MEAAVARLCLSAGRTPPTCALQGSPMGVAMAAAAAGTWRPMRGSPAAVTVAVGLSHHHPGSPVPVSPKARSSGIASRGGVAQSGGGVATAQSVGLPGTEAHSPTAG